MFRSLSLLLVGMVEVAKNVKRHFLHIHISNYTPILILIFICWNIIAQKEWIKIINKPIMIFVQIIPDYQWWQG